MSRRVALVSVMLLAGLVIAVVGATAALRLIGSGPFGPDGKALNQADVQRSLAQRTPAGPAASPAATSSPARSGSPGHSPGFTTGVFPASGGTVFASCSSGQVTLTRWIPASGFGTDGVYRGPTASAWVKFKSGSTEQTVTATCAAGRPHFVTTADDRGRGGGGGGH